MSRKPSVPKYRHFKARDLACVDLPGGKRIYLGKYNSPESWEKYHRIVQEFLGDGPVLFDGKPGRQVLIAELAAEYWQFAEKRYGEGPRDIVKAALRWLRKSHDEMLVKDFGPRALSSIMSAMVEDGATRQWTNQIAATIKRIFKWGVAQELCDVSVHQALACVNAIRKGETKAPETKKRKDVPAEDVEKTIPHLPPILDDVVRIHQLLGCRSLELLGMRPCDVDRSESVWIFRPAKHKNEHHDQERWIFIGPQVQQILAPYLLRDAEAFCFSPRESIAKQREMKRAARKSKVQPSQRDRSRPGARKAGPSYDRRSYRRAIVRACKLAGVEPWTPRQLRHSAATRLRKLFGETAAQITLGHASPATTKLYGLENVQLAKEVASKVG